MKLLIDTQILLWSLMEPKKLSSLGRELVSAPENTVFLSAVSMWEIRIKESIGKLQLPLKFAEQVAELGFEDLPLTTQHTEWLRELPLLHRDPFDRILIAQAKAEGLKLLSADSRLAEYGEFVIPVRG
jgi:PIN domain nuclease of toxin-antitoxin system